MKTEARSTKHEIRNKHEARNQKRFDLEDRTKKFAKDVRLFVGALPKNAGNREDGKQLVRSSGSVGANYLEANQSLSKKDFIMRVKIAKKEARETIYWLELITANELNRKEQSRLQKEATELMNILGAIVRNSS
ncbi:MAG: four helix bundle protein [Candidatus Saccharibacteria bacterium]|nr:four helix bundle protein [Candidatus Saccharibacteria bacterium]